VSSNAPNSVVSERVPEPSTETAKNNIVFRESYQPPDRRRAELILAPTGPFRPLIEEYLATAAVNHYSPVTFGQARRNLGSFFQFVVESEHIETLDDIRPSTVTRYINAERMRGIRSCNRNLLNCVSTFFVWLIAQGRYDRGNPVVKRYHRPLI
jgi:hypothetical protein